MTPDAYVWTVEVAALTAEGAPTTLRWATPGGYMTWPEDTPDNAFFRDVGLEIGPLRRTALRGGVLGQVVERSYGALTVTNVGDMDVVRSYAVAGREVVVRRGRRSGHMPGDHPVYWRGVAGMPSIDLYTMTIPLVSRLDQALTSLLTDATYAGTNTDGGGIEGDGEMADRAKPFGLGTFRHVAPVLVNGERGIYHVTVAEALGAGVALEVFEAAHPLTMGVQRSSAAALHTTAPAASMVDWCLDDAEGLYFRLGATAQGVITCSVSGTDTVAALVRRLLIGPGGLPESAVPPASFDAFATALPGLAGDWDEGGGTVGDMIDRLLSGTGGVLVERLDGTLAIVRPTDVTTGPAAFDLERRHLVRGRSAISRVATTVPHYAVEFGYGHLWRTFDEGTIAPAELASLGGLRDADQVARTEDAVLKARYPTSTVLKVTSRLADRADAEALAARALALEERRHQPIAATLAVDDIAGLELGDVVRNATGRLGHDPEYWTIVGLTLTNQRTATLELW